MTQLNHHRLPTFGVGSDISANAWRAIFRQLYAGGVIALDVAGHGSWTMTARDREVLRGKAAVELRKEALVEREDKRLPRPTPAGGANGQALLGTDAALFEALKAIRRGLQRKKKSRLM